MPYPNSTASLIVIAQTSASAVGGQYSFIERQISGSNLFLVTDANGNLTGSSVFSNGTFTNINVTGALTASIISASVAVTASSILDTGALTINGLVSASGGLTASNIYDAGILTVAGNTILANVTASNLSASGAVTASNIYDAGTLRVIGNTTVAALSSSGGLTGSLFVPLSASISFSGSGTSTFASQSSIGYSTDGNYGDFLITNNNVVRMRVGGSSGNITFNNTSGSSQLILGPAITSVYGGVITMDNSGSISASSISASGQLSASSVYIANGLFVGGGLTASISGSITTANTASTISITDTPSTAGTYYLTFVDGTTGARVLRTDSATLTWNPGTNTFSASGDFSSSNAWHTNLTSVGSTFLSNVTASSISASTTLSASTEWVNNLTVANIATISSSNITSTANATNYNVGALTVVGGVGIGKDLYVSGSTTIGGNLTILGSGSIVNISSSTVVIGANRIELNAFSGGGTSQRYAGIDLVDSGSTNAVTSSFLWDSLNNYWLVTNDQTGSGPIVTSSAILLQGPTSSFGSEYLLTPNYFLKVQSAVGNMVTSSLSEVAGSLLYNGTISASVVSGSSVYIGTTIIAPTGSFTNLTVVTGSAPGTGSQVPATPTAGGLPGQIEIDNNFMYVFTNNTWKRVPLSVWAL